jgi:uncharacterized protein (TIGR02594 family)
VKAKLIVASPGLNLRTTPSADAAVLLVLPGGASLELVEEAGGWRRVTWRIGDATATGWVFGAHVAPEAPAVAPWVAHAQAALARGVSEVPGSRHHPEIIRYHQRTSLRASADEVPWCSSFACDCMELAGFRSTRSAAARSWLEWGQQLKAPVPGCVVVFKRGSNPASGHVGFFVKEADGMVHVLGGNQGNAVSVSAYRRFDVLGYRWPPSHPLP